MRLLVTGGSGFLGGYVLAEAARRGHSCVALARSPSAARTVTAPAAPLPWPDDPRRRPALARSSPARAVTRWSTWRRSGSGTPPRSFARRPGRGSTAPCSSPPPRSPRRCPHPPRRCGSPPSSDIRCSGLKWTTAADHDLRRGRRQEPVPAARLLARARRAPVPLVLPCRRGRRLQQPVHVADLAAAVLAAVERAAAAGRCYDVAGPEPLTFAELLRASAAAVGCRVRSLPVPLARWSRSPAATSGSAAGRGSGPSSGSGWPRTRRSRSKPPPATWPTRPARSPRASGAEAAALGLAPATPSSAHRRGLLITVDSHAEEPCLAWPRARSPPSWASACRCAARPGCCSAPTRRTCHRPPGSPSPG